MIYGLSWTFYRFILKAIYCIFQWLYLISLKPFFSIFLMKRWRFWSLANFSQVFTVLISSKFTYQDHLNSETIASPVHPDVTVTHRNFSITNATFLHTLGFFGTFSLSSSASTSWFHLWIHPQYYRQFETFAFLSLGRISLWFLFGYLCQPHWYPVALKVRVTTSSFDKGLTLWLRIPQPTRISNPATTSNRNFFTVFLLILLCSITGVDYLYILLVSVSQLKYLLIWST